MVVQYDRAAIQPLIDETSKVPKLLKQAQDLRVGCFQDCRSKYSRLTGAAQDKLYQARREVSDAESALQAAQSEYSAASRIVSRRNSDGSYSTQYADPAGMEAAQRKMAQARQRQAAAQQKAAEAQGILTELSNTWQQYGASAQAALMRAGDFHAALAAVAANAARDLRTFGQHMTNARNALYGERTSAVKATSGASVPSGAAPGWCQDTGMTSVHIGSNGQKQFTMTIGGSAQTFPCTKSGAAKAYRAALKTGDQDLISRTAAMFEVETIREQLELTAGDPNVPQLGGYYGKVKVEDPAKFEANHIPSQATQAEDKDMLPALTMSRYDHSDTPSYTGRQNAQLASYDGNVTYKAAIAQQIGQGGSGYINAMRAELLDLRQSTGNRYDGGVSAYLDAVIDMIATRGIPKAKL